MATQSKGQYHHKDKKIAVWKVVSETSVNGIKTTTYGLAIPDKIWAYYRQTGGTVTLVKGAVAFLNTVQDAVFVTNWRPPEELQATYKIVYNHKIYDVQAVDDFEGYTNELTVTVKLNESQTFNKKPNLGIIDF